jgi:hypothetical protein
VSEGRPGGADADGERKALNETLWLVLVLGRQPGHHGAAGQVFKSPLGE